MVTPEAFDGQSSQAMKQYGVTKPISMAGPTDTDLQRSVELEKVWKFPVSIPVRWQFESWRVESLMVALVLKFLISAGLYESQEQVTLREEVLQQIGQVDSYFAFLFCPSILNVYS